MGTPWYAADVWQPFKWTASDTSAHSGIDLGTPVGTPITAPMAGTLLDEGLRPWGVQVDELVNIGGHTEVLSWLHLRDFVPLAPGSTLTPGELLGHSGTPPPGFGSGAHTHFEETMGNLAPYVSSYGPHHPTATSYPVDPAGLLTRLRAGNTLAGGSGGSPAGSTLQATLQASTGGGFSFNPADWMAAIQSAFTDSFQRTGLVFFGGLLILVGVIVLFFSSGAAAESAKVAEVAA